MRLDLFVTVTSYLFNEQTKLKIILMPLKLSKWIALYVLDSFHFIYR